MEHVSRTVAENLRRLRTEKGFSLEMLAQSSGVSRSRLGQIERGEANPSIATLWEIAKALRVEFSALVTAPGTDRVVVRRGDVEPMVEDRGRLRTYPLFGLDPTLGFEVYSTEIDPGGHLEAVPHSEGTREVVTVLAGELVLTVGDERYVLGCGDAMRFAADLPHGYRNEGSGPTAFSMLVCYPRG